MSAKAVLRLWRSQSTATVVENFFLNLFHLARFGWRLIVEPVEM
jgi:hypothetical protein